MQVGQNAYEADVLTAIKTDQREIFYDIVDIKPIKIETSGKAHIESEDSRSSTEIKEENYVHKNRISNEKLELEKEYQTIKDKKHEAYKIGRAHV